MYVQTFFKQKHWCRILFFIGVINYTLLIEVNMTLIYYSGFRNCNFDDYYLLRF